MFCSKNVRCLLGVACYVLWSLGLTVFHSEFILNHMPRWNKERTKNLDVFRGCEISERGGIWNGRDILLARLNE